MHNRILLTPYFLDQSSPTLSGLGGKDWHLNPSRPAGETPLARIGSVHRGLRDLVAATTARGERPVSIGGDCCAAIPVLAGLQQGGVDPVLLWLDAHGDFNTAETTISGFLGGMPLAMLTGRGDQTLMQASLARTLADSEVLLFDARDLDPAERDLLNASGVVRLDAVDAVLDALPSDRPVHVHLDCDVLDSDAAPAMRYPVRGGPSVADLVRLGSALHASGRVAGVSVTVWDIEADSDGRTGAACRAVLNAMIGRDGL